MKLKLNPLPDAIRGKRLVVVDDSIVRGTTTRQIVQALREAGATRCTPASRRRRSSGRASTASTCPRDRSWSRRTSRSTRSTRYVGADSLGYLSQEGLVQAAGSPKDDFCRACFDGEYPIAIPERAGKFVLEDQLQLPDRLSRP